MILFICLVFNNKWFMFNMLINLYLIPSGKQCKNLRTQELLSTLSHYFCPAVQSVFCFFKPHTLEIIFVILSMQLLLRFNCIFVLFLFGSHFTFYFISQFHSRVILFPPELHSLETPLSRLLVIYSVHFVYLKMYFFHSQF